MRPLYVIAVVVLTSLGSFGQSSNKTKEELDEYCVYVSETLADKVDTGIVQLENTMSDLPAANQARAQQQLTELKAGSKAIRRAACYSPNIATAHAAVEVARQKESALYKTMIKEAQAHQADEYRKKAQ